MRPSALLLVILASSGMYSQATPFEPTSDDDVLERTPPSLSAQLGELQALRTRVTVEPTNATLATQLARRYVEVARAESDPRYLGYAQATLAPWFSAPAAATNDMRVLAAIVKQQRHDFDGALRDLDRVLKDDPRNAQAWLTSASVLQVKGEQREAIAHCVTLSLLPGAGALGSICLAKSLALIGQADRADLLLRNVLDAASNTTATERLWALTVRAEMLSRIGRPTEAEDCFAEAMSLGIHDTYLLTAFADFLLDSGAATRVRAMLQNEDRVDALLLRLTVAENRLGLPIQQRIGALEARFAASRERGDRVHLRDEATFTLYVLERAKPALALALANWATQREPRDARIVLEAALAANEPVVATPVLDDVDQSGLQDLKLTALARALQQR